MNNITLASYHLDKSRLPLQKLHYQTEEQKELHQQQQQQPQQQQLRSQRPPYTMFHPLRNPSSYPNGTDLTGFRNNHRAETARAAATTIHSSGDTGGNLPSSQQNQYADDPPLPSISQPTRASHRPGILAGGYTAHPGFAAVHMSLARDAALNHNSAVPAFVPHPQRMIPSSQCSQICEDIAVTSTIPANDFTGSNTFIGSNTFTESNGIPGCKTLTGSNAFPGSNSFSGGSNGCSGPNRCAASNSFAGPVHRDPVKKTQLISTTERAPQERRNETFKVFSSNGHGTAKTNRGFNSRTQNNRYFPQNSYGSLSGSSFAVAPLGLRPTSVISSEYPMPTRPYVPSVVRSTIDFALTKNRTLTALPEPTNDVKSSRKLSIQGGGFVHRNHLESSTMTNTSRPTVEFQCRSASSGKPMLGKRVTMPASPKVSMIVRSEDTVIQASESSEQQLDNVEPAEIDTPRNKEAQTKNLSSSTSLTATTAMPTPEVSNRHISSQIDEATGLLHSAQKNNGAQTTLDGPQPTLGGPQTTLDGAIKTLDGSTALALDGIVNTLDGTLDGTVNGIATLPKSFQSSIRRTLPPQPLSAAKDNDVSTNWYNSRNATKPPSATRSGSGQKYVLPHSTQHKWVKSFSLGYSPVGRNAKEKVAHVMQNVNAPDVEGRRRNNDFEGAYWRSGDRPEVIQLRPLQHQIADSGSIKTYRSSDRNWKNGGSIITHQKLTKVTPSLTNRSIMKHQPLGRVIQQPENGGKPQLPSSMRKLVGSVIKAVTDVGTRYYYVQRLVQTAIYGAVFAALESTKPELAVDGEAKPPFTRKVALKVMSTTLERLNRGKVQEDAWAEVKFHNAMTGHRNVLVYDNRWQDDQNMYLVMPFAEYEDLFEVLTKKHRPLDEARARWIFQQVLEGAAFLHSKGVAFRDHSLENVLMFVDDTTKHFVPRVTDPGQAIFMEIDPKKRTVKEMPCERPFGKAYRPPELYLCSTYNPIKVDSFCLGWMLYYVVLRSPAFTKAVINDEKWALIRDGTTKRVLMESSTFALSPELIDLIFKMLDPDPRKRPSPARCLQHPWFKGEQIPFGPEILDPAENSKPCILFSPRKALKLQQKAQEMNNNIVKQTCVVHQPLQRTRGA